MKITSYNDTPRKVPFINLRPERAIWTPNRWAQFTPAQLAHLVSKKLGQPVLSSDRRFLINLLKKMAL